MAATTTRRTHAPQKPEHKIGPLHNGLGISIWLNSVESEKGTRFFRSNVAKIVMWHRLIDRPFWRTRYRSNAT